MDKRLSSRDNLSWHEHSGTELHTDSKLVLHDVARLIDLREYIFFSAHTDLLIYADLNFGCAENTMKVNKE